VLFGPCRSCYGDVPLRMKGLLAADRTYYDRTRPRGSEESHRHVYGLHIDEPARTNLEPRIAFSVSSYRAVVIHSCGQVTEVSRGQGLASGGLEIHDIEGLVRG